MSGWRQDQRDCAMRLWPPGRRVCAGLLLVIALASGTGLSSGGGDPLVATVAVGALPSAIAVDPRSGHVFIANAGDNTVTMLDAATGAVLHTSAVGGTPAQVLVLPATQRVLVMNEGDGTVSGLDTRDGTVLRTLPLAQVRVAAVEDLTRRVFVFAGPQAAPGAPGLTAARMGRAGAPLMAVLDAPAGPRGRGASPYQGLAQVVDATGRPLFLTDAAQSWGQVVPALGGRLFLTNAAQNSISLVAAPSGRLLRTVAVGHLPLAVAVDPATDRAFVVNHWGAGSAPGGAGNVSVLEAHSGRVLRTIAVGPDPTLVAVDGPAGRVLIVHGWGGRDIADPAPPQGGLDVLDARSGAVLGSVAAGEVPAPTTVLATTPQVVAVDEQRGHSFVLDAPAANLGNARTAAGGSLSVVDDRTARLLRRLPLTAPPVAVALDERAARLVVASVDWACRTAASPWWEIWGRIVPASLQRWVPLVPPAPPLCGTNGRVAVFDLTRL